MELTTEQAQARVGLLGAHTKSLFTFFEEFSSPYELNNETENPRPFGDRKYKNQLQEIKNGASKVLKVYMDDIRQYFLKENNDREFYEGLMMNTYRYLELLYISSEMLLETLEKDETNPKFGLYYDPIDELRESLMNENKLPINLRSNYDILLINGNDDYVMKMKYVNADFVGCLVLIEVDVLRIGDILPKLKIATYECDICHNHSYKTVEGNNYLPLMDCVNCVSTKNVKSTLKFHPKLSKFEKYQEVRVQEPLIHLNEGEMPKSLKCQLSNTLVGLLRPGDNVMLYGVLLPIFREGFVNSKFTLLSDKVFKILNVQQLKKLKLYDNIKQQNLIEELSKDPNIYERLAKSIAPEIYGLEDVKKALLLQLIGGCDSTKKDGGFIRGNIHVLLMGDPGVAKSELMKKICLISNRSIYTTGKGSSSSGLTASIIKDPITGNTILEGGALILSSNGICCIDEFDKMDDNDRSSIYEVMEQQKVSIAKSGHISTLQAHSSILASCNPVNGVYDINKSLFYNLNLSYALLSRFDLMFLILDNINLNNDYMLSNYKLHLFLNSESSSGPTDNLNASGERGGTKRRSNGSHGEKEILDKNLIRMYINNCKKYKPVASESILKQLSKWYVDNRQNELQNELYRSSFNNYTYNYNYNYNYNYTSNNNSSSNNYSSNNSNFNNSTSNFNTTNFNNNDQLTYITPRTILSILRLSQALARLRFSNEISVDDLNESIRLYENMKNTLNLHLSEYSQKRKKSSSSLIMSILKKIRNNLKSNVQDWDGWINVYELEQQVLSNGFKMKDLQEFINKYSQLSIVLLRNNNTQLSFPEDVK